MIKSVLKYIWLLLPSFFVVDFFAQEQLQVQAQLTSKTIKIGEQTQLVLRAKMINANSAKITFPRLSDSLAPHIEMVSASNIDTFFPEKDNPQLTGKQQTVLITSYDSGFHVLPPFKFYLNNDTSQAYETEALLLEVQTLKIDTNAASIKDIKLPFEEQYNWKDDVPFYATIAGLIVLAILIFFIIRRLLKKKTVVEVIKPKLNEPAHIYALRVLQAAKQEKVYEQGKTKDFYSIISDTLRLYIEERCSIPALENTTEETIQSLNRNASLIPAHISQLKQILVTADFVKFAKMEPLASEHDFNIDSAIAFVSNTFIVKPENSSNPNVPKVDDIKVNQG
jgi:hypothetical protein